MKKLLILALISIFSLSECLDSEKKIKYDLSSTEDQGLLFQFLFQKHGYALRKKETIDKIISLEDLRSGSKNELSKCVLANYDTLKIADEFNNQIIESFRVVISGNIMDQKEKNKEIEVSRWIFNTSEKCEFFYNLIIRSECESLYSDLDGLPKKRFFIVENFLYFTSSVDFDTNTFKNEVEYFHKKAKKIYFRGINIDSDYFKIRRNPKF